MFFYLLIKTRTSFYTPVLWYEYWVFVAENFEAVCFLSVASAALFLFYGSACCGGILCQKNMSWKKSIG